MKLDIAQTYAGGTIWSPRSAKQTKKIHIVEYARF